MPLNKLNQPKNICSCLEIILFFISRGFVILFLLTGFNAVEFGNKSYLIIFVLTVNG